MNEMTVFLAFVGFVGMGVYLIYSALKFHIHGKETIGLITKIEDYYDNSEEYLVQSNLVFVEFQTVDGKRIEGRHIRASLSYNMWVGNKISIFYLSNDPKQFEFSIPNKWLGLIFGSISILFGLFLFVEFSSVFQEDVLILN